jgi:hypothetical protein
MRTVRVAVLLSLHQGLGIAIDIEFMWRLKAGAALPGERARLLINSKSNKTNKAV